MKKKLLLGSAIGVGILLLILAILFFRIERSQKIVSLESQIPELGESFEMRLEVWNPPLFLTNGVSADPRAPSWLDASAVMYKTNLSFEEFKKSVTSEYLRYYKIDEKSFKQMRASLEGHPGVKSTVFWAIYLEIKQVEYIIVAKQLLE